MLAETLIIPHIRKNQIQLLFYYTCFMENIQKLLCEMQVDFICACTNTRTKAPSGRITQNHSSAHAVWPRVRSAHCAWYNLHV